MTVEVQTFHAFEDLAKSIALRLIQRHEPFLSQPAADGQGGIVIGWLRSLGKKGITKQAATHMLREDLDEAMLTLRSRIASVGHERLGAARAGVLLHLAMLPEIGAARMLTWESLWAALSAERWNDAADALLLTEWPTVMTGTSQQRVRGVALQRVIRTGSQFTDADERRLGASGAPA